METMANEMLDIVGDASRRKAGWKDKKGRWILKPAGKTNREDGSERWVGNGQRMANAHEAENVCFVVAKS